MSSFNFPVCLFVNIHFYKVEREIGEYSRYSKTSGELERYNLRYGFYPAGGLNTTSTQAVLGYQKAVIPGQLLNEKGNSYNISRSYPATRGAIYPRSRAPRVQRGD